MRGGHGKISILRKGPLAPLEHDVMRVEHSVQRETALGSTCDDYLYTVGVFVPRPSVVPSALPCLPISFLETIDQHGSLLRYIIRVFVARAKNTETPKMGVKIALGVTESGGLQANRA